MNTIKKFSILFGLISSISATAIQAVPLYYTFEGTVYDISIHSDAAPLMSLGDSLTYVFLVDDQVTGPINNVYSPPNGEYEYGIRREPVGEGVEDYHYQFHTELVSATGLRFDEDSSDDTANGLFQGAVQYSTDPTSYFYNNPASPYLYLGGKGLNGSLVMDVYLQVPRTNIESYAGILQWMSENDIISGMNTLILTDDEGNSNRYTSHLQLTSISATTSVPEPSTYLLMGLGLIGVGARRLKQLLS